MKSNFNILAFSFAVSIFVVSVSAVFPFIKNFETLSGNQLAQVGGAAPASDGLTKADELLKFLESLEKEINNIVIRPPGSSATDTDLFTLIDLPALGTQGINLFKPVIEKTIALNFKGASPITFESLEGPFDFKGGTYPGIGSPVPCQKEIVKTCTMKLVFSPSRFDFSKGEKPAVRFVYASGGKHFGKILSFDDPGFFPATTHVAVISPNDPVALGFQSDLEIKLYSIKDGDPNVASLSPFSAVSVSGLNDIFSLKENDCPASKSDTTTLCFLTFTFRPKADIVSQRDVEFQWYDGVAFKKQIFQLKGETLSNDISLDAPSRNLLVIYNQNNPESVALKDYYLANRPGFKDTNTLGVKLPSPSPCVGLQCSRGETIPKGIFRDTIAEPIASWMKDHPGKNIKTIILMRGIPSRLVNPEISEENIRGSVQTALAERFNIYATSLDMGSAEAVRRYIDKLKAMYESMPNPSVLISSRGTGKEGTTYYFEDAQGKNDDISGSSARHARAEVLTNNPQADISYRAQSESHFSKASDVLGFMTWGNNGYLGGYYMFDKNDPLVKAKDNWFGNVKFTGNSGWYLLQTIESYNGQWANGEWFDKQGANGERIIVIPHDENFQGNFIKWFSRTAFGGSNYENTPVAAVTHVEEPNLAGINNQRLFSCWDSGIVFEYCAWLSRKTPFFQAVGDPWVTK